MGWNKEEIMTHSETRPPAGFSVEVTSFSMRSSGKRPESRVDKLLMGTAPSGDRL